MYDPDILRQGIELMARWESYDLERSIGIGDLALVVQPIRQGNNTHGGNALKKFAEDLGVGLSTLRSWRIAAHHFTTERREQVRASNVRIPFEVIRDAVGTTPAPNGKDRWSTLTSMIHEAAALPEVQRRVKADHYRTAIGRVPRSRPLATIPIQPTTKVVAAERTPPTPAVTAILEDRAQVGAVFLSASEDAELAQLAVATLASTSAGMDALVRAVPTQDTLSRSAALLEADANRTRGVPRLLASILRNLKELADTLQENGPVPGTSQELAVKLCGEIQSTAEWISGLSTGTSKVTDEALATLLKGEK